MSYVVIWFIWHNEFLLTLVMTSGDLLLRLQTAIESVSSNQYLMVLFITIILTLIRYGFDNLTQILADDDNSDEFSLLQNGNGAKTESEMDIKQLLATLDIAQTKLADSLAREKQVKKDKTETINTIFQLQAKLDELTADIVILNKENHELKDSLSNK
jgi:hypothetical protein